MRSLPLFILLLLFLVSCNHTSQNENAKFEVFKNRFEKTYPKIFPAPSVTPIDSLVNFSLTDKEQLRRAQFCEKQLADLQNIEVEQLSIENQQYFIEIFKRLKNDLEKIEQNVILETD